jgi:hypothetical protein
MEPFSFFGSRRENVIERASRGIARARKRGRHMYYGHWHFGIESEAKQVTSAVILWCRETLATCRRPFGIDYFDLAVSFVDGHGRAHDSLALKELRPAILYGASLEEKLAEFIEKRVALLTREDRPLHIATALFSWGDAAHEALPATV